MTGYQVFLLFVLMAWPLAIGAMLFGMQKLERYVAVTDADDPVEAGLEPVSGPSPEREVKIVFGDQVVGESK